MATKITERECLNIVEGSLAAARECEVRGSTAAARVHYDAADAFAREASLIRIKEGRGI